MAPKDKQRPIVAVRKKKIVAGGPMAAPPDGGDRLGGLAESAERRRCQRSSRRTCSR